MLGQIAQATLHCRLRSRRDSSRGKLSNCRGSASANRNHPMEPWSHSAQPDPVSGQRGHRKCAMEETGSGLLQAFWALSDFLTLGEAMLQILRRARRSDFWLAAHYYTRSCDALLRRNHCSPKFSAGSALLKATLLEGGWWMWASILSRMPLPTA